MDFCQSITHVNGQTTVLVVILTILACSPAYGNYNYESCNNSNSVCVKQDQCIDGQVDIDGINQIQPRILGDDSDDSDEECKVHDEVCCYVPKTERNSGETLPVTYTSSETPDDPLSRQCGQRTDFPERVDQDLETHQFEFPWNVALFNVGGKRKQFLCGGTLIDYYVVITAARCVQWETPTNLMVELGRSDLHAGKERYNQEIRVNKLIIHQNYTSSSYVHNVALLLLSEAAQLGRAANRVCLADSSIKHDDYSLCYVVGWSNIPSIEATNRQLKLRSSIAREQECTEPIRRVNRVFNFKLPKENICTAYMDDTVPCERAPGSGLVCESTLVESHYFLVGIASYSLRNCSAHNVNDVFVSISHYLAWVDEHMADNGLGTNYYRPNPTISDDM